MQDAPKFHQSKSSVNLTANQLKNAEVHVALMVGARSCKPSLPEERRLSVTRSLSGKNKQSFISEKRLNLPKFS
jgi:hypothetical protein